MRAGTSRPIERCTVDDVYTQREGAKGQYQAAHYFFGRGLRGTVADYQRPLPDGTNKRCVRIELAQVASSSAPAAPAALRMELTLSSAAALVAVLTGQAPQLHVRLTRPGVKKSLSVMRGTQQGLSWVVRMYARGGNGETALTCPVDADNALQIVRIADMVLQDAGQGLDPASWLRQVERMGVLVARASEQEGAGDADH